MTDDEQRAAERRRRMDELLAQAETDVSRTRAANDKPAARPVVEARRGTFRRGLLGVLLLLGLALVLGGTAATLGRFTGADFDEARRHGTATVEKCQRRGPVTLKGFGYVDQCVVAVSWNTGPASRVVIDEPGFMKGEAPGDTFQIGENSGSRGSVSYSRPELPDRGWVGWVSAFVGLLAVFALLAVYFYLRDVIKDLRRRA
ncbi:DUF6346 domain-containing protein [Actinoplanes sp. NPDC026623]|uniref:DUF6346 domain-containing protein n=1 Tax=Actinoplanes sp. NPDC026623 TaxID=3155610 RepID=UPI0033EF4C85